MTSALFSASDYGVCSDGSDSVPGVRRALQAMHGEAGATLVFPKGRYHFWPDLADEQYVFPSNNDPGLKRIAFPLFDRSGLVIDGGGSEFIFHGRIVPFVLQGSRSVRLSNFSLDWDRTFHNEGEILAAVKDEATGLTRVDLRIPSQFPFQVSSGRLQFRYEWPLDREQSAIGNLLEFDAVRRETAFLVYDNYGVSSSYSAEQLEDGVVRLTGNFTTLPVPGNIVSIGGNDRECPGIVISECTDTALAGITIHHCGGMGVIGQCSENIRLERVQVTPSAREGRLRMISTTADATHFVCCRGLIEMYDCLFENQLDDATNVHGVYGRISEVVSPTEVMIEWVHPQQQGMDIAPAGDTLEFVQRETLLTLHQSKVTKSTRINSQFCRVTLESPLPPQVKPGDAAASLSSTPDVVIKGCTTRGNRARGFLLSSPGRMVVEDNHIHAPGAAILIAGDAGDWFESGAVRDVTIRNNHFDNCGYGVWGSACIVISPGIEQEFRAGNDYHRSITIEGNTFDAFDPRLVHAFCTDGLTFQGNTVRRSADYPAPAEPGKPFDIEDCTRVKIEA